MKLSILIFSLLFTSSKSSIIECDFQYNSQLYQYICIVENYQPDSSADFELAEVRGQHLEGKSDDSVDAIYSHRKINFFPYQLPKFFINIESVTIYQANIKSINKFDLQHFGHDLKELNLDKNQIEVIERDLFDFNPNLEAISMASNKISRVDVEAFDKLGNLKFLSLWNNPCTGWGFAVHDPSKVGAIVRVLKEKC